MKRILIIIFCILFAGVLFAVTPITFVYSDEIDDLSKQITQLQKAMDDSKKATAPLESQLSSLQAQLTGIEQRVSFIETDLAKKKESIAKGYDKLTDQKAEFNAAVRNHYMKNYLASPLIVFISARDASDVTRLLFYQQKSAEADQQVITSIALTLTGLEARQKRLKEEEEKLAVVKEKLAGERTQVATVVKGAKDYQSKLSREIAEVSVKQQQLIAQKQASLNLPTSLGGGTMMCTDDRKIDPGFGGGFAFYTFGIPHRVGLNQYGAFGRAKAGQNYQDILKVYFDGISFEKKDNIRIKVQGFGEMNLEDYMLGIYEMPGSWPIDALKAQAVAARSYALSYTNNGAKEICTTQSCQVYKGGNKGGDWEKAVRETAGEVLTRDGQVITAWYASTSGGYTFTTSDVGWSARSYTKRVRDTNGDISTFQDLFDKAYDRDSPCFYAAQGARAEYNKSAWLKPEEVADIVNVLLLAKQDSSIQKHLSQVDKPNPDGAETWNHDTVKQEFKNRGGNPYNSISSVSVSWDSQAGRTTSINLSGDKGSQSFSANEFTSYFNLRAPSNIQIVGPLFNVEKR